MTESEQIQIRPVASGEEAVAAELVTRVFRQFVAPLFPPEGVSEFLSYATVPALEQRLADGNLFLAAWSQERMAAFIEVRDLGHIALFFTDGSLQGKGLGRRLLARALDICRKRKADMERLTVNASPNAVAAYQRLGFEPTDGKLTRNGISFVPMALAVNPDRGHT
ncbi:MAG: GNAT family N-acetyltransferase [Desulfarculaceae bacterium]|nr:GNAT family N-acetyltransferase [Desulfarculaceae bacterium]MCF8047443.1 GNAT family N-acetyltransferase [Desulfarculaceae bacterium]MCF8064206.1 GNAT family N-acetyltransferase [Desulfarculaceae bacterium]MCF8098101.1 GNAT family N-acetyltransferase [Desulfarculaceae bacterium]MCF8123850.1 GNAT family N-acetyltransferase [Desulfarculaceae bacterium]